jgi:hypothetical protein
MRRIPPLLFFLICGAAVARGQGNSDFQQTQGQSTPHSGGDSDFQQSQVQPNPIPGSSSGFQQSGVQAGQGNGGGGQGGGGGSAGGNADRDQSRTSGDGGAGGPDGGGSTDDSGGEDAKSSEMSISDARVNFATVVEAYVAKKSSNGYWSYAEKASGKKQKSWRLKLPSVSDKTVREEDENRYSGLVKLRDARGGRPLTLEFVVDFSGVKWKVISVKPAAAAGQ